MPQSVPLLWLPQDPLPLQLPVVQLPEAHSPLTSSEEVWLPQEPRPVHFWQNPQSAFWLES